jgi:hypothetical protein
LGGRRGINGGETILYHIIISNCFYVHTHMNGFNSRDFQSRFGVYSRKSDGMRHRLATQSFDGLFRHLQFSGEWNSEYTSPHRMGTRSSTHAEHSR